MNPDSKAAVYQPQMDGLRAIALLFVLVHHFAVNFRYGPLGVRFFFVVSGFLITRILLKSRSKCDAKVARWQGEMGNFQMRRLIRTLPVYYLALFLAAVLGIEPVRETLGWTLTFLTNFYMDSIGYFPPAISHFWSLAVQEQFYLFWPFLIFFLPRKAIPYSFPILIVISLGFRLWCIRSGASDITRWFSLPGNLDSFAAGGIVAYIAQSNPTLTTRASTRVWSGCLALSGLIVADSLRGLPLTNPYSIWVEFFEVAFMAWLVACSVGGFSGWIGKFLSLKPLTYLGRISYAIYVYHVFIAILLQPLLTQYLDGADVSSIVARFIIRSGVSIGVAALSWRYFEQPMLKAREHFAAWFAR